MSILFSQNLLKNNEIRPQEGDFTEVLSTIALAPKMLYFHGKMPEKRSKVVAIVGTRRPTKYGEQVAYDLAFAAAKRGAVVVSGLAYGIDSIAHRGALDAGGVTVAVLGTPIDRIYPVKHIGLAERILEQGGCVMSELEPGAEFVPKTCFLRRNRLISGLADVVVVPEAAERSGSLNTAAHALDQGREIMAVPGDITRPMSVGCNRLIRQGATPCTGVDDLLALLFPVAKRKRMPKAAEIRGDSEAETLILRAIAGGAREGEAIIRETGLLAEVFSQNITLLEIKGRVRAMGMNCWALRGEME